MQPLMLLQSAGLAVLAAWLPAAHADQAQTPSNAPSVSASAPGAAASRAATARPTPYSAPVAVPPATVPTTPRPPSVAVPTPLRPPPTQSTQCDAGGCWSSDGQRLNRVGPNIVAPGGAVCSEVAGVVRCP